MMGRAGQFERCFSSLFNIGKQIVLCVTLTGILIRLVFGCVKHIRTIRKACYAYCEQSCQCVYKLHWKNSQLSAVVKFAWICCFSSRPCSEIISLAITFYLCHIPVTKGYEIGACLIHIDHKELWDDMDPDYHYHCFRVLLIQLLEFFFRILKFVLCCRLCFYKARSTQPEVYLVTSDAWALCSFHAQPSWFNHV